MAELLQARGQRDLNPRPPEPHAGQESYSKRQLVGFSMASERRRRMPLPEMSGFAGRNGTNNSTTTTPRSTWTALGSLILHDGGQDDNACPLARSGRRHLSPRPLNPNASISRGITTKVPTTRCPGRQTASKAYLPDYGPSIHYRR